MDKQYLKEHDIYESVRKMRNLFEFTNTAGAYDLNEADDEMPDMGGAPGPEMGAGPQGADSGMGGGPEMPGGDAAPMDGAPAPADGGMDGASGQGAEGFSPQGEDPQMGATPETDPNADPEEDEEVIDVDDLTNSQEATEEKVGILSDKFDKVLSMLDKINAQIEAGDDRIEKLKSDMEKRNPTPIEKMTIRSTKSGPFSQTPEDYWENSAPENYSPEDDMNGEGMPEYVITKDDIDSFRDWNSIAKSFDEFPISIKDMFGY